jgi:hypothetical protein
LASEQIAACKPGATMSSLAAPRCGHIKVNGTQCGSPAQRNERFCYFHQHSRPITFAVGRGYHDYSSSEVILPAFEDAHSIQLTLRQVTELILRHKIDDKTAGLVLYALQIASSNLKRMELEKAATRAGCHRSRNRIGNSHRCHH